jgi:O-antigen/teichoic acid export membrane protein
MLHLPALVRSAVLLLAASYAVGAFVENKAAYFLGVERMHVWTEASTVMGLITGVIGIILIATTHQLLAFCAAPVLGQLGALGWLTYRMPDGVRASARASWTEVRALTHSLLPFAAAFIATTVYYRADILILSHMRVPAEVGLYGAASKVLDLTQALALACAGALLPRLARMANTRRASGTVATLILSGTVPFATLLFILHGQFVRAVFGNAYVDAAPLLALLAPVIVPLTLNMFALVFLAAHDGMRAAALAFAAASALNICLNVLLVPAHGAAGAATAKLVSESMLAIALLWSVHTRQRP